MSILLRDAIAEILALFILIAFGNGYTIASAVAPPRSRPRTATLRLHTKTPGSLFRRATSCCPAAFLSPTPLAGTPGVWGSSGGAKKKKQAGTRTSRSERATYGGLTQARYMEARRSQAEMLELCAVVPPMAQVAAYSEKATPSVGTLASTASFLLPWGRRNRLEKLHQTAMSAGISSILCS